MKPKPPVKHRLHLPLPHLTKKKLLLIVLCMAIIVAGIFVYRAHRQSTMSQSTSSSATTNTSATSSTVSPTMPTIPTGFPNASDTGVPAAIPLSAYRGPLNITTAGTTISDRLITGCPIISAAQVTITDTKIVCSTKGSAVTINKTASDVVITNTEIDGSSVADEDLSGSNFSLERANLYGSHDGLHLGSNDTIKDSYIHNLAKQDGIHSDDVQVVKGNSATNDLFMHDTFDDTEPGDVRLNSSFHVGANINRNFVIEDSYLNGGSYTLQFDPSLPAGHTIEIINNAFGRDCQDGIFDGGSGVTVSGNYWIDNNQPATQANSKPSAGGCMGKS